MQHHAVTVAIILCVYPGGGGDGSGVWVPATLKLPPVTLMLPVLQWTLSNLLTQVKGSTTMMQQVPVAAAAMAYSIVPSLQLA